MVPYGGDGRSSVCVRHCRYGRIDVEYCSTPSFEQDLLYLCTTAADVIDANSGS